MFDPIKELNLEISERATTSRLGEIPTIAQHRNCDMKKLMKVLFMNVQLVPCWFEW